MGKALMTFVFLWLVLYGSIELFGYATWHQRITWIKSLLYSGFLATLVFAVMFLLVQIF